MVGFVHITKGDNFIWSDSQKFQYSNLQIKKENYFLFSLLSPFKFTLKKYKNYKTKEISFLPLLASVQLLNKIINLLLILYRRI